jgi:FMN phosphatase YigB (HAD superfamily)
MNKKVSLIITDLDNTLYDWLAIWHASFSVMFAEVQRISQVQPDQLKREFREVFQKHGTSEYAFALQELPCLLSRHSKEQIPSVFASAIDAFRRARRENLVVYPDVIETIQALKAQGCLVVGYTESMSFYTNHRLRKLGLDLLLDYLYSPTDHDLPDDVTREQIRKYPDEHYKLRNTVHKFTPKGELKPNPKLLLDIIVDVGGEVGRTVYIGDKLLKDVAMAQQAGVADIWARYGANTDRPEYELLRSVSHWSEDAVAREREKEKLVRPTYILERSFKDLLPCFTFVSHSEDGQDRITHVLEMWKTTVGVQQHFNDLELRIRNYAVTLLVAVLGVTAVTLKDNSRLEVFGLETTLPATVILAGLVGWLAFYFMDRLWYHRLLLGSVLHGLSIEKPNAAKYPEIQLTTTIGNASPIQVGRFKIRTHHKLDFFYILVACGLAFFSFVLNKYNPKVNNAVGSAATNLPGLKIPVIIKTN